MGKIQRAEHFGGRDFYRDAIHESCRAVVAILDGMAHS
jgi:hypothetical protein